MILIDKHSIMSGGHGNVKLKYNGVFRLQMHMLLHCLERSRHITIC